MGKWIEEFKLQEARFATKKMTTRNALQLIAYWAQERGEQLSAPEWMPVMARTLREAPAVEQTAFQKLMSMDPLIPNAASRAFKRLLTSTLGLKANEPAVNADVRADVLEFAERSAKLLDQNAPNVRPPRFAPGKRLDDKAGELVFQAVKFLAKKKKKPQNAALILAVLIGILFWDPK